MKKKLFLGLLAAAAVTFTACQKDEVINEVPQDQPIEFGTYVGRDAQTKASEQTLSTLQASGVGFGVYAYYTDGSAYNSGSSPLNFLWDEHVTYSNPDWGYEPTKYWPSETGKKFTFIAYAPGNDNTNITEKPSKTSAYTGDPKFKFTVNETVASQTDLLYASIKDYETKENNDVQEFIFNHALSRIGFSAKPTNQNDKISITGISITGKFTKNATFNVHSGDFTTPINNSEVTTYNPIVKNVVITGSSAVSITEDGNYIMIIPTTEFVSTSNISITVNYDLQVYDDKIYNNYSAIVKKTETGTISNINFQKGKAYNIVLTVSPSDPIKFGVESVTDWSTTPGNLVTEVPVTATPAL